jgi:hypothetical protein
MTGDRSGDTQGDIPSSVREEDHIENPDEYVTPYDGKKKAEIALQRRQDLVSAITRKIERHRALNEKATDHRDHRLLEARKEANIANRMDDKRIANEPLDEDESRIAEVWIEEERKRREQRWAKEDQQKQEKERLEFYESSLPMNENKLYWTAEAHIEKLEAKIKKENGPDSTVPRHKRGERKHDMQQEIYHVQRIIAKVKAREPLSQTDKDTIGKWDVVESPRRKKPDVDPVKEEPPIKYQMPKDLRDILRPKVKVPEKYREVYEQIKRH